MDDRDAAARRARVVAVPGARAPGAAAGAEAGADARAGPRAGGGPGVTRAAAPQRTDTPVVAYRAFRWRRGRLVSATRGDRWTAELHEATCRVAASHPAPHPACHCGIHAF